MIKVLNFSPYARGLAHEKLLKLILLNISHKNIQVDNLACNGCYSVCQRSQANSWENSFSRCFTCNAGQSEFVKISNVNRSMNVRSSTSNTGNSGSTTFNNLKISSYLSNEDTEQSFKAIHLTSVENLTELTWSKVRLFDLCLSTFEARFNTREFDVKNKNQEEFLRQLMLVSLQNYIAVHKLANNSKYKISFVVDGNDVLTSSFIVAARAVGCNPVVLKYNKLDGNVFVVNPINSEIKVLENVEQIIEDAVTTSDYTFVNELVMNVLMFIGIESEQLALPIVGVR